MKLHAPDISPNISIGISIPRPQSQIIRDTFSNLKFSHLVVGGVATFFVLSFSLFLFSFPSKTTIANQTVSRTPSLAQAAVTSLPVLEIHIANNGLTLVRDARIVAIEGPRLLVSSAWGSQEFKWIVLTNASAFETRTFGTRFWSRDNEPISLRDLKIGDRVTITGMLVSTAKEPTIDAAAVRSSE